MGDTPPSSIRTRPDREGLFQLASEQRGYFTTAQASEYGYSRSLLAHHARTGTFQRVYTGVYRFRDYPSTPREELAAAWLAVGKDVAVVSHESALELWELGDLIPDSIHLSVPRSRRHLPRLPGVTIHTTTRPLDRNSVRTLDGIPVTTPLRTVVDVAEANVAPDQLGLVLVQAFNRGRINRDALLSEATRRGPRVGRMIGDTITSDLPSYREIG
jgi:predicted transcriptional regulator of viral defense system